MPRTPPAADLAALVPAPGVIVLLPPKALVALLLHAAASRSLALARSRPAVNVEPDVATSRMDCP